MSSKLDLFLNGNLNQTPMEKNASPNKGERVPILTHQREVMEKELAKLEKAGLQGTPTYNRVRRRLRNLRIADVVGPSPKCFSAAEFRKMITD